MIELPPRPAEVFFTQARITFPALVRNGLTQPKRKARITPDSPQRNSLFEAGMPGTRLLLVGFLLEQKCQPLANARLDFWQTDASGEYYNAGFRLRGHQFTSTSLSTLTL